LPNSSEQADFVRLVTRLGYLDADAACECLEESVARGAQATQVALQRGAITPVQYEIVETLLRPNETIPGYEILDLIGHGGMGAVFRARQKNLNRLVALKTVLVSQMSGPGAITRFEQEATTIGRLVHPHIVAAYDFGRHQGRLFLAMELVEGENAEDRLVRRGPFEEAVTWQILRQAASGLAHAAEQGIVHRDIKPANLMLLKPPAGLSLPSGVPLLKIADFGLAYLSDEPGERTRLTSSGTALGSPHYMAPEQLTSAHLDLRTDMYALGATAYHLLSGKPPFHGLPMAVLVGQKLASGPEVLSNIAPHISPATIDLIEDLMRREPAERPADYETVIARIDELLGELTAVAGAATARVPRSDIAVASAETQAVAAEKTAVEMAGAPRRFNKRWLGPAALLLLLATGSSVWFWRATQRPSPRLLVPTGQMVQLFNGQSLAGWRNLGGGWRDTTDEEGSPVMEGRNGTIARALPNWTPGDATSGYRLAFAFNPSQAQALEVQFDLRQESTSRSPRGVLRLTPAGAQLGEKDADRGQFRPYGPLAPWPKELDALHDVVLEKNGCYWLQLDAIPVGTFPAKAKLPAAEFRLVVEGGTAIFADFSVEPLAPPGAAPGK
jgi:tRNA A-37 threonylcarbamoyl transferase component Bud32